MKRYALVGYGCGHSLSPAIHNAAFKELLIDAKFEIFETRDLTGFMEKVKNGEISGGSVTMPFKKTVLPYLQEIDKSVEKIEACNCFNGLKGFNTDCDGAFRALKEAVDLERKRIYLLGAGGAGSAIAYGLRDYDVTIFNLTLPEAFEIAEKYGFEARELRDLDLNYDILINATSCGFKNDESCVPIELLNPKATVFDIVYEPLETRLIRDALQVGCKTITGEKMLLYQGAAAFEIWTGKKAPIDVMKSALRSALSFP